MHLAFARESEVRGHSGEGEALRICWKKECSMPPTSRCDNPTTRISSLAGDSEYDFSQGSASVFLRYHFLLRQTRIKSGDF